MGFHSKTIQNKINTVPTHAKLHVFWYTFNFIMVNGKLM